jgi:hypothetical protein
MDCHWKLLAIQLSSHLVWLVRYGTYTTNQGNASFVVVNILLSLFIIYQPILNISNTTGATRGAGIILVIYLFINLGCFSTSCSINNNNKTRVSDKISFVSTRISNNTSDGFTNNAKQLHKKRSSYTDTNVISSKVADITFVSVYLDRFLCGVL